jgi:hypothetical protein
MTQLWPRTDDFDNALTTHDRLAHWINCRPVTAGFVAAYWTRGDNDTTAIPVATTTTNNATAYLYRQSNYDDVSVRHSTSLRIDGIPPEPSYITTVGCLARVTGGTLASGGTLIQYVQDIYGYAFTMEGSSGAALVSWKLLRYDGGTVTTLAQFLNFSLTASQFDAALPFDLRLQARNVGGNVELKAYIGNFYSPTPGGSTLVPQEIQLFSYTDSSAGKLTGPGRCGVITTKLGQLLGINNGQRTHSVTLQALTAGVPTTVLMRDEFSRTLALASWKVTYTPLAEARYCIDSSFMGDLRGCQPGGYPSARLLSGPTSGAARLLQLVSSRYTALSSQRPVDNNQYQHPEATFEFVAVGASDNAFPAVFAYGAATGTPTANSLYSSIGPTVRGYSAWLDYDAQLVRIRRHEIGVAPVELAEYSMTITTATQYRVGLQCIPLDVAGGPVSVSLYIGGAAVIPSLASGAPAGISVNGAGSVIDSSSARITSGEIEGMIWREPTTGSFNTIVDVHRWTEGTLSPPTASTDMTSIVFADEGTPSATFQLSSNRPVPLRSPVSYDHGHEVLTTAFDSGHIHARTLRPPRKVWDKLQTVPVDRSDRDELRTFWRARGGGVEPFFWTSPDDDVTYTVRFLPDSWEEVELFRDIWQVSFGLEEVL